VVGKEGSGLIRPANGDSFRFESLGDRDGLGPVLGLISAQGGNEEQGGRNQQGRTIKFP
jgi:hypothetical protein